MLRVLTYHRIAKREESSALNPGLISATPETFDRQMQHVARHYAVVSVEEVLHALETRGLVPPRAVLLTFDDAYRDFAENAWPILKTYGLPVTLFVPTAYPSQPERAFWWDRLYRAVVQSTCHELRHPVFGMLPLGSREQRLDVLGKIQTQLKNLPHRVTTALVEELCEATDESTSAPASVLSWDELRQLANEGVTLGPHTRTHPILTQLTPEEVRDEVRGSRDDLGREVGRVLPIFCYPNGDHDETTLAIVKEEGFKLAFATTDGQNDLARVHPLRLHRTNITPRTTLPIFRLRLQRWVSYPDRLRHHAKSNSLSTDA